MRDVMDVNVSIIIPSYGRPAQLVDCIQQIRTVTPKVEIIVIADGNDVDTYKAALDLGVVAKLNKEISGPAKLWNIGAAMAKGDYLVMGADDLWFHEGWLDACVKALAKFRGRAFVAFNDLSPMAGDLATHFLVSRSILVNDFNGVLVPPVYQHYFVDTEMTHRAITNKYFVYAEDAIVEHKHHLWDKSEKDATYELGDSRLEQDEAVFKERQELGFPNTWERQFDMGVEEVEGWGKVAISTRIYRHPEPAFFNSWSLLLVKGIERGDTIISGQTGIPGHVAANTIARRFLDTTANSVLFLDDDMEFDWDTLRRIRNDPDTWDYDVIFGFCTHRTMPPHAVVMRKLDPQPGLPVSLEGTRYGVMRDFPDNAIIDVDVVGLAFTLIKRHVFEAMVSPHGTTYTYWFEWGKANEGEDTMFSKRARELGFRLGVNTKTKIGHVGSYTFGWKDHKQWLENVKGNNNDKI